MKTIVSFFEREQWQKARELLLRQLAKEPDSHWLLTRIGTTYYEQRNYAMALHYTEQAYRLAPSCPLVLWDYACVLDMLGNSGEAVAVWKRLLRKGERRTANDSCGEGLRWARSLLNDCRYRIGVALYKCGYVAPARRYLRQHLVHRRRGTSSIFDLKEVTNRLNQVLSNSAAE